MAESVIKSYFPSQVVSDAEKLSYDYGLKVAKAIEQELFYDDNNQFKRDSFFYILILIRYFSTTSKPF